MLLSTLAALPLMGGGKEHNEVHQFLLKVAQGGWQGSPVVVRLQPRGGRDQQGDDDNNSRLELCDNGHRKCGN